MVTGSNSSSSSKAMKTVTSGEVYGNECEWTSERVNERMIIKKSSAGKKESEINNIRVDNGGRKEEGRKRREDAGALHLNTERRWCKSVCGKVVLKMFQSTITNWLCVGTWLASNGQRYTMGNVGGKSKSIKIRRFMCVPECVDVDW